MHAVELAYALMGTGCRRVRCVRTEGADVALGEWADGRLATVRAVRDGAHQTGFVAITEKQAVQGRSSGYGYRELLKRVVRMCQTGEWPLPPEALVEPVAFQEAALLSVARDGAPVGLTEVGLTDGGTPRVSAGPAPEPAAGPGPPPRARGAPAPDAAGRAAALGERAVQLTQALVRVNTVNRHAGDARPGSEAAGQRLLAPLLQELGARLEQFDCPPTSTSASACSGRATATSPTAPTCWPSSPTAPAAPPWCSRATWTPWASTT